MKIWRYLFVFMFRKVFLKIFDFFNLNYFFIIFYCLKKLKLKIYYFNIFLNKKYLTKNYEVGHNLKEPFRFHKYGHWAQFGFVC
jgi:hypothetical protein